jgi:hypothetical protein
MMMSLDTFNATLGHDAPPALPPALQALWYDAKGDWKAAHDHLQEEGDTDSAWVHAYLHRKEGDASNAAYWYRRAGKPVSAETLETEWCDIVCTLLSRDGA